MDIVTWSSAKDVALFILAVYGAALSTFNWRQSLKKDSRQITVTASSAMPTYAGGSVGAPYAKVEAINTGQRVVTIKTLTFELPTGGRLYSMHQSGFPGMPDTQLPATLNDGQAAFMMMSYAEIGEALISAGKMSEINLTPVCVNSADNVYRGSPWKVDPKEFLQMGRE